MFVYLQLANIHRIQPINNYFQPLQQDYKKNASSIIFIKRNLNKFISKNQNLQHLLRPLVGLEQLPNHPHYHT
jgi:hypothetical protein